MKAARTFCASHRVVLYIACVCTLTLLVQVFGLPWDW